MTGRQDSRKIIAPLFSDYRLLPHAVIETLRGEAYRGGRSIVALRRVAFPVAQWQTQPIYSSYDSNNSLAFLRWTPRATGVRVIRYYMLVLAKRLSSIAIDRIEKRRGAFVHSVRDSVKIPMRQTIALLHFYDTTGTCLRFAVARFSHHPFFRIVAPRAK